MKLTVQQIKSSVGFTLIELLVVIAIIGVLAAALIATIDPLEQIKKSQDATVKNVAVEYLNAITRYYATHQAFPWDTVANGGAGCTTPASATAISTLTTCTTAMINDRELKNGFLDSTALPKVYLTLSGVAPTQVLTICFQPTSLSQIAQAKYNISGGAGTTHWCTR